MLTCSLTDHQILLFLNTDVPSDYNYQGTSLSWSAAAGQSRSGPARDVKAKWPLCESGTLPVNHISDWCG